MSNFTSEVKETALKLEKLHSVTEDEMARTAEKAKMLSLELGNLYFAIENLLINHKHFLHYVISLKQPIEEKEGFDLLSYYGLLKTFIPIKQPVAESRRFRSLLETFLLKIDTLDTHLSSLISQSKLELYSLDKPLKNPIIRRITATFIEMHLTIFKNLLNPQDQNEQQLRLLAKHIHVLEAKTEALKIRIAEIKKLNILEFIAYIESPLSRNLYPQLLCPMITFFGKGKNNKNLVHEMQNLFDDLHGKPFSAYALVGAIHLIKEQIVVLLHQSLCDSLTHHINQFLEHIQQGAEQDYEKTQCIQHFETQAKDLAVIWPQITHPPISLPVTPLSTHELEAMNAFPAA